MKNDIKCKYCGKIYSSPSEMRKRKCHSHPDGAWCGYCTPKSGDEASWKIRKWMESLEAESKERRREAEKRERDKAEYKKRTPLLDCFFGTYEVEPSSYDLQIRHSNLKRLACDLANGINSKTRDAINTIYALRDGCDFVLNNADAQKEGSLNTWIEEIKRLKDEVVDWSFWVSLYWLATMNNSMAEHFHVKQVIPMLHVTNKKGDEKEKEVELAIERHIVHSWHKNQDPEQNSIFAALLKKVTDHTFWGVLYCLYWIKLRPTPWNDKKVWPIEVKPKEDPAKIKCRDFAKKLQDAYAKNFAPFKSLWIARGEGNVLVFYKLRVGRRFVSMEVAVSPGAVKATIYWHNGTLEDIQAFANKNAQLKKLFPEIEAQQLQHSKIAYADVPAFIDKVLVALRSPTPQEAPKASPRVDKCGDFAKKLLDTYSKNYAPFKKLWIYKDNTLVFDEYSVDGKTVAIDVAALPDEKVNVTFLMRNGNLNDVQAFASKNAQLKPLFTETVAQRLLHSKIAYADVPTFINKVLAALRSPTSQKAPEADSKTEGAAKSVKSGPVASVAVQSFNAGEMLKTLRSAALGMSWRESKDKTPYWGALVDGVAICSWQKRIQSNLSCELNLSSDKTHIYKGECWMQCTMRFETKDGKASLNIWGEFWGYWLDGKQSKIDFTQPPVSATLATVEQTFSSAWKPFGVTGNIGHHEKNIWFNVAIPITSIDVIKESKFGADLRASLSKVVRSFATLKPFCTWK